MAHLDGALKSGLLAGPGFLADRIWNHTPAPGLVTAVVVTIGPLVVRHLNRWPA